MPDIKINYPGDVRESLASSGPMGPNLKGEFHKVESASYDPEADRTTAHLAVIGGDDA
ncbi:hypothetical protein [Pseudactinotalea sp. Z1732]|uniref:hypothetical protein n=1 Tax=Micrococcales TaxID=85006 RepID=UPI003C7E60A1